MITIKLFKCIARLEPANDNNPHHKELALLIKPVSISQANNPSAYHRWFKMPIMEIIE